jgi:hypothetical protein
MEGERRRDAVHALLAERRACLVRLAQRTLLERLLYAGAATADDVRAAVPLPAGIDPRAYGAVPGPLVGAGAIRAAGYVRTARPEARVRPVTRWELADRTAAVAWLATHPELPPPEAAEGEIVQPTLWD